MDHEQKLKFLQNITHMALDHAKNTPNVPTPEGKMSHDKMLSFVSGIATKGIQHFDSGGTALTGPIGNVGNNVTQGGGVGGALGNFIGSNNGYQASGAPVQGGTNVGQLQTSYNNAQNALGNQANVAGTLKFGLNQGAANQDQLAQMYLNQAQGNGPNPALAQLNQATGQNIAQQAALAAGQRGGGANAGLLARQNAQNSGAIQQQSVGQAAVMQAQQQLAAEQNLQNLSSSQVGQGTQAVQGLNNATQNEQNILQGANTSLNNANISQQSNINNVNAAISTANQNNSSNLFGDLAGGISSAVGSIFYKGGEVGKDKKQVEHMPWVRAPKKMAEGGIIGEQTGGPQSYVGQWLNSTPDMQGPGQQPIANINTNIADPFAKVKSPMGAPEANPLAGFDPASAGTIGGAGAADLPIADIALLAAKGGPIPGKAKINGDSLKNDTVPAMLSPGEVVIDKDTLADKGPVGQMARAVAAHIAKRNKKK